MNNIKVSVVLPCYNVEKYIREGLNSIMAQTLSEWEAIMVDDGATDSTGQICDEYTEKDSRFRVIHTKNQGVSCARNTGMEDAKGELLYFMDPDDWIESNCLERCYEIYQQHNCDIIQFDKYYVFGDEKRPDHTTDCGVWEHSDIIKKFTCKMVGLGQEALNHWYKGGNVWDEKKNLGIWSFAFKRSFIEENELRFDPKISLFEDILFAIDCTIKAKTLVSIPDILYNYNVRTSGVCMRSTNDRERIYKDKSNLVSERVRLRSIVKDCDLHDYYLGSQVLSAIELTVKLSQKWSNNRMVTQYVKSPYVRESIEKVSLKGAPLKFKIPVQLLKWHAQKVLFFICWLLNKFGLASKMSM